MVGARPQKLNLQNFCTCENLERVEFIATCTWCDFVDTVQLLLLFLELPMMYTRYLQPVPKTDCLPDPHGGLLKDISLFINKAHFIL